MRRGRGLPWWLLARTLALGGAGIIASLYALDRAHERAATRSRNTTGQAAEHRSERMLDAPDLERAAPHLAPEREARPTPNPTPTKDRTR